MKHNNFYSKLFGIKAVPAEEMIREIEEGIKPPFIETLRDPQEIQKLGFHLVDSAKEEIRMLLFLGRHQISTFLNNSMSMSVYEPKRSMGSEGCK